MATPTAHIALQSRTSSDCWCECAFTHRLSRVRTVDTSGDTYLATIDQGRSASIEWHDNAHKQSFSHTQIKHNTGANK
jgi:hypothetical protein